MYIAYQNRVQPKINTMADVKTHTPQKRANAKERRKLITISIKPSELQTIKAMATLQKTNVSKLLITNTLK